MACRHFIALSTRRDVADEPIRALVSRLMGLYPHLLTELCKSLHDIFDFAKAGNWTLVSECLIVNPDLVNQTNEVSQLFCLIVDEIYEFFINTTYLFVTRLIETSDLFFTSLREKEAAKPLCQR